MMYIIVAELVGIITIITISVGVRHTVINRCKSKKPHFSVGYCVVMDASSHLDEAESTSGGLASALKEALVGKAPMCDSDDTVVNSREKKEIVDNLLSSSSQSVIHDVDTSSEQESIKSGLATEMRKRRLSNATSLDADSVGCEKKVKTASGSHSDELSVSHFCLLHYVWCGLADNLLTNQLVVSEVAD